MEPPGAVGTPSEASSELEVDAAQLLALLEALQEADGLRRIAESDAAECTDVSDSSIGTPSQQPCHEDKVIIVPGRILDGDASRL